MGISTPIILNYWPPRPQTDLIVSLTLAHHFRSSPASNDVFKCLHRIDLDLASSCML